MSAHLHSTLVKGCYRCELGKDEEEAARQEAVRVIGQAICPAFYDPEWDEDGEQHVCDVCQEAAERALNALDEEGYL